MSIVDKLSDAEMKWMSSVGGTIPGEGAVFRGYDMFKTFGEWNWLAMFYFSATLAYSYFGMLSWLFKN